MCNKTITRIDQFTWHWNKQTKVRDSAGETLNNKKKKPMNERLNRRIDPRTHLLSQTATVDPGSMRTASNLYWGAVPCLCISGFFLSLCNWKPGFPMLGSPCSRSSFVCLFVPLSDEWLFCCMSSSLCKKFHHYICYIIYRNICILYIWDAESKGMLPFRKL